MKIIDEAVLNLFRRKPNCEWCKRWGGGMDPHHFWFKRGMGGGNRLDHPWNLVGLCRGWSGGVWVSCHEDAERGRITKYDLLAVVAARENVLQATIVDELHRLSRAPKEELDAYQRTSPWTGQADALDQRNGVRLDLAGAGDLGESGMAPDQGGWYEL